jgi:hypothetical protein
MISLQKRIYNSKNSYDVTIARLAIDVERVDEIEISNFGGTTIETSKRWVGIMEKDSGEFEVVKPNTSALPFRILDGNFYTLFVQGKIINNGSHCGISVAFGLELLPFIRLVVLCLFPLAIAVTLMINDDFESIKKILPFLLVFTVPSIVVLIFQLNKTEKEIKDSLGIR